MHTSTDEHNRFPNWVLLAIFALGALLQLALVPRQSLWTDEIFSLAIATGHSLEHPAALADPARGDFQEPPIATLPDQLRRYIRHEQPPASPARVVRAVLISDTSPPLYYLLLYGWTFCFGTTDMAVRFFSAFWSLASFPLLASIAWRTGGRDSVIPACLLFAVSPAAIYFGNEVRMYSLLVFLVLAGSWVSLLLAQDGESIGRYVLWVLASVAGFLTHYFFLFPWLAMLGYLLFNPGRLRRHNLLVSVCVTGFALLPWYVHVPDQLHRWRVTKDWLKLTSPRRSLVHAATNQFVEFFSSTGAGLWVVPVWSWLMGVVLFAGIIAAMFWKLSLRALTGPALLVWLWFIAACAGPLIMDLMQRTTLIRYPRYSLAALPAANLIAALALSTFSRRIRLLALVLIIVAWSPSLLGIYGKTSRGNQPFLRVAQLLRQTTNSADVILVHSIPAGVLGIARYTDTPAGITSWVEQLKTHRVPESLNEIADHNRRLWYIWIEHNLREPRPELDWLRQNAELVSSKRAESITVMEFRPKNTEFFRFAYHGTGPSTNE